MTKNKINKSICHAYDLLVKFIDNIHNYSKNDVVAIYLSFLNIDPIFFSDVTSERHNAECTRLIKAFAKYPKIFDEIYSYLIFKKSKIDFLDIYSDEQIKYITNLDVVNTKLIACAGSGKTRSIIGRIKFLAEHKFVNKNEIFMITFSKTAASDFHQKVKNLFPDYAEFCQIKNFSTIDSLAKSVLCKFKSHKSENVEILSIAFRNFLREMTPLDIKAVTKIKKISHLFVDEAQDLNEIQYDIIRLLQEKFGTVCELVGDPNQNIYQFRRSSSLYLMNFLAKKYELTLNFRSTQQIIDFAESIKPIQTTQSRSAKDLKGPAVTILTNSSSEIHRRMLHFINIYQKEKDLSNIAIICPTRGIGSYDSVGLSVFFNFLKMNNIPFNQLYDESGNNDGKKRSVDKTMGHINLITYHGTKGLEFDVVFVMDFYQSLFNIMPTEEEHRLNQYLLYVASSRAISIMFVCTYINTHGGYLNHWITSIPPEHYISDGLLKIPKLSFRKNDNGQIINGVTELISEMSDENLNMIHDALKITEHKALFTRRIYKDFTHIDRGKDETLFGIFCEELFYLQHHLARIMKPREISMIQSIIDMKFVIVDNDSDLKILKGYISTSQLTWEQFDLMRNNMPDNICRMIEKYFNRDEELNDCVICTNDFVKIIENNMDDIRKTYVRYRNPKSYNYDYKKILIDFFYLIVVQYAYNINHYYYINNHGKDKHELLNNGTELYEAINNYVSYNFLTCDLNLKVHVRYDKMMLMGEIDFIEEYRNLKSETIVEIKCAKEISIKYYIQLLLYNFCYYYEKNETSKLFENDFKIINLLTGLEHRIIIKISPTNMFNLLITLANIGNLNFDNLSLVYDLETTDKIKIINNPTTLKKEDRKCNKIFPEITEIAIKDYDTGMVLLNTLVKPNGKINKEVQEMTGITPGMLENKPGIDFIKAVLEKKMKNFTNCKMMAHNGCGFDNQIIMHNKMVDPKKISFLDTLSIIPIHLPIGMKLDSKKLGKIYSRLFNKTFSGHRAMSDVDALIKIMKFLKIKF